MTNPSQAQPSPPPEMPIPLPCVGTALASSPAPTLFMALDTTRTFVTSSGKQGKLGQSPRPERSRHRAEPGQAASVDPHRARSACPQLRWQEGDRERRERISPTGNAKAPGVPTRSRSSSLASCCRTSPACRCWSISPPCAARRMRLGKNPKTHRAARAGGPRRSTTACRWTSLRHAGLAGPEHEARVPAQPRALRVPEVGHAGLRHLQASCPRASASCTR